MKIYYSKKQEFVRSLNNFIKRTDVDSLDRKSSLECDTDDCETCKRFHRAATYLCASIKRLLGCISVNCFATRA